MRLLIQARLFVDDRLQIAGEATTAAEAIDVARSTKPALIILDHAIEGPVMGLQAAPELKRAAPEAKILLFTAFDLAREAAAEPAVDRYLPKSQISKLLTVVQELLGLETR